MLNTYVQTKKKTKQRIHMPLLCFCLFIIFCMILFALLPQIYIPTAKKGILLFVNNVLPSLFPFFFFTKLLTQLQIFSIQQTNKKSFTNKLFGLPRSCLYIFLLSILSGYPVSAKIIADLKKENQLNENETIRCLALCSTSGPVFILGTVGFLFLNNITAGIILLTSHILASICNGIIFRKFSYKNMKNDAFLNKNGNLINKKNYEKTSILEAISNSIFESIKSIFVVGGYIILFYILIEILNNSHILYPIQQVLTFTLSPFHIPATYANAILSGCLELTRGCFELATLPLPKFNIICISGLLGWSGISILLQSLHFLKDTKIKTRHFILIKGVQSILNIFICTLLVFICY